MPDNPIPEAPDSATGVLWAVVVAGAIFFKSVIDRILNAFLLSRKSDKIERLAQDVEDLRRAQRRLEGRQDFVEDSSAAVARLTKAKDDG